MEFDRDPEREELEKDVRKAVAALQKYMKVAAFKLPLGEAQQVIAGTREDIRGLV